MSHYSILGIPENSSIIVIKKAYRKLAMKYHPDKTKGNEQLTKKFIQIKTSYEQLINPTPKTTSRARTGGIGAVTVTKSNIRPNGSVQFFIKYNQYVKNVSFNETKSFTFPHDRSEVYLVITKEELREENYDIKLKFYDISGHIYKANYKFDIPKLSTKQKIRKFFKMKY